MCGSRDLLHKNDITIRNGDGIKCIKKSITKEVLEYLVNRGMTIGEIGKCLNVGYNTVVRHLRKHDLKTKNMVIYESRPTRKYDSNGNALCPDCGVILTHDNCHLRGGGLFYCVCKKCRAARGYKERKEFKIKAIEHKGGKCISCGYNKNTAALEFHHTNPNEKEVDPSRMYYESWKKAQIEIDKCDLLCSNCHREEHYRIDERKAIATEFNKNLLSSLSDVILTGKNTGEESCGRCDAVLTEDNRAAGTKKGTCKKCHSKYVMNKTIVGKQRAVEYMGGCCSICGYNKCIRAIEFHHVDPAKKSPTYNKRFRSWSFERQKKELENCIIVCSNCHREIHADLRLDELDSTP